ncbi:MAG TPA: O-antigen ligase [Longimicrobium sp.]|nr:O-antigen ligase [Longimicrobium sp.]
MEDAAARGLRHAEALFGVAGLFLFSGALIPLLLSESGVDLSPDGGNVLLRAIYTCIYAGSLFLVALRWRSAIAVAFRSWATIALVGTTAFGVFLAERYDTRQLLKLLAVTLGIAAVMSLAFSVGLPSYGLDKGDHAGAWRGIYAQKNGLGQTMVLATLVCFLLRPLVAGRARVAVTALMGLTVLLVLLSTSKTALTALAALLALSALYRALRWHFTVALPIVTSGVLVGSGIALWLVSNSEEILVAMGKDPTLTGRTPMWEAITASIAARPWLGYGYSAFWMGRSGPSAQVIEVIEWVTPHAHNGYLDVALQLGLVGLAFFLAALAAAIPRAVAAVRATTTADGLWPMVFLSYMVLYNFTETTLLQQNNVYWALFVATLCSPLLHPAVRGRVADARAAGPPSRRPLARTGAR